ncbi:MAG: serine/threonine-protein kinase, partial [Anaerolineae bacterium]
PLPLEQSLLFALQVARGMEYAVGKIVGLVHRDLKPENILIGYDEIAKVTDFGLASTISGVSEQLGVDLSGGGNRQRTQVTQGVVGTPLYMAPEQWRHETLDERADIYALGCILYEMLTGHVAAEGENQDELRQVHLTGRIKPPPTSIPKEVVTVLRAMLAPFCGLCWCRNENAGCVIGMMLRWCWPVRTRPLPDNTPPSPKLQPTLPEPTESPLANPTIQWACPIWILASWA